MMHRQGLLDKKLTFASGPTGKAGPSLLSWWTMAYLVGSAEKADLALGMLDAGMLAVWKFDRFSRVGLYAVADLIEFLDKNATRKPQPLFVAVRDGLNSDHPAWRIIAAVLAETARMERGNIQLRVKSS